MKQRILGAFIASLLVVLVVPHALSAETNSAGNSTVTANSGVTTKGGDLQVQIKTLLEQVMTLQKRLAELLAQVKDRPVLPPTPQVLPTPAPDIARWCKIQRTLSVGAEGDDVSAMQSFLKENGYFRAEPTGYYGSVTADAVAKWQTAEGISSIGVVGPTSRERLMAKWCGGVDTQRFTAEPRRGEAPLAVVFSTWIGGLRSANTSYTIDFGDGATEPATECNAPADACVSPGQNKHTYTSNGTFIATLNKTIDPCAGQTACRAAVHQVVVGKLEIVVGSLPACTKEYKPVCGALQVQCITTPCNPVPTTYGNMCEMKAVGATFLYEGACHDSYPNPADDPKCKAWYDGCNNCSRSSPNGPAMCTMRACLAADNATFAQGKPYCTAWFDDTANKPPIISSFTGPSMLKVNETGTWEVKASDPENGTLSYSVSWGDEVTNATGANIGAAAAMEFTQTTTFTHSYAAKGVYTVVVYVQDAAGKTAKEARKVVVGDLVACTEEYAPVCGRPAGCADTCPDGAYCLMTKMMCRMPDPVTYSNACKMKEAGATLISSGVCPTPPLAISFFKASPASVSSGQQTVLSWSVSNASACSLSDFGHVNGLNESVFSVGSRSVSPVETTTYTLACYSTGSTAPVTKTVQVSVTAVASINKPPVISSFSGPTVLSTGQTGTWKISASDPENGSLSYNVSWGDEISYALSSAGANMAYDAFIQTSTFTHAYASAGIYAVKISARDSAGMTANTSATVKVTDGSVTPVACTMDYTPMCGLPAGCFNLPPNAGQCSVAGNAKTYSNRCVLNAAGAMFLYQGECNAATTSQ